MYIFADIVNRIQPENEIQQFGRKRCVGERANTKSTIIDYFGYYTTPFRF